MNDVASDDAADDAANGGHGAPARLLLRRNILQRGVIALALAAVFAYLLMQRLQHLDFAAMQLAFGAVSALGWAGALALTCTAFWAVGQYDVVLHRHFATGVAPHIARRAGISAIAVSQTLGLGVVTGAVLRWRMLAGHVDMQAWGSAGANTGADTGFTAGGQGLWLASRLTVAVALSFLAGWAVVTAVCVLLFGAPAQAWAAGAVLGLACAGLVCCMIAPPVRLRGAVLRWPNLFTITALLALCAVDTLAAAAALYALLPAQVALPFSTLLPAFLLAYGAGILSGTPGGMGAFELTLLALLQHPSEAPILAAVLAWRLVYFVLPAALGAGIAILGPPRSAGSSDGKGQQGRDIQSYPSVDAFGAAHRDHTLCAVAETGIAAQHPAGPILAAGKTAWLVAPLGHVMVGLFDPIMLRPTAPPSFASYPPASYPPARNGHMRKDDLASGDGAFCEGAFCEGVGPQAAFAMLARAARLRGLLAVGYKLSQRNAAHARAMGWPVWRVAFEAVVKPLDFNLSCPARAGLRRKLRRAEAAGISAAYCAHVDLPLDELDSVAAHWAHAHGGERGFSMGRYDRAYIAAQRVYIARMPTTQGGGIAGFITLHHRSDEWTLDIMRHRANLPDGAMHALVWAALRDARAAGVARVSLAAVPSAAFAPSFLARGVGAWALALCEKIGLGRWLHVDRGHGLRRFKESFAPKWHPRYLCAPSRFALVLGAIAIAKAIARPDPLPCAQPLICPQKGCQSAPCVQNTFAQPPRIWQGKAKHITN